MTVISLNRARRQRGVRTFLWAGMARIRRPFREIPAKCRYLIAHPAFRQSRVLTLSRLLHWRLRCALGIPAILTLRRWNAQFYLPPRWHGAGTTMIYALRENYEKELIHLHRFISPGMVVIDGGANCGIYTIIAAKLVGPSGLVLSFEPGRQAFCVLERNVRLNRLENVRMYHSALADKEGTAGLYHHERAPNSYSLGSPDTIDVAFEDVKTRTLYHVVQKEIGRQVGLIKLDVEGAEELVMRGAGTIITRSHPTIIFEFNGPAATRLGLRPSGSWELLESLGYRFFSLAEQGDLCEMNRPPAANGADNIVAIHGSQRK